MAAMSRTRFAILCASFWLLLSACAATSPSTESGEVAVVQFSYDGLKPEVVHITPDGNIKWVNLASDSRGVVVFPDSISTSFSCGGALGPYFVATEDGYRSLPIESFEPEDVKLPCSLEAGTYDYEVWIMGTGLGDFGASSAQRSLPGKIVVK
jgi:hypothetical protein